MIQPDLTPDEIEALSMDCPTEFAPPPGWTWKRWHELKAARTSGRAKLQCLPRCLPDE
jgi:hypothetical protein